MRRELYIGGRLADIDGVAIPLNFACSEIADLSGVSGNYSLTVKLPLTGDNIMIAYFANLPNTSPAALWTGYKTTASYFIDGVPIFQDADVRLLSTEKTIDVQITFGNLTWLDVLANIKLKDIVAEFLVVNEFNWNYWVVENETNDVKWIMADWGGTFESGVHAERMHPAINVWKLWDAIWEKLNQLGVIWKQPDWFPESDLWLPIMSQILNPALPVGAAFALAANLKLTDQVDSSNVFDGFSEFTYTTPNTGIVFDNVKRYFIIPKDGNYRIQMNSNIIITATVDGYESVIIDFQLKYRDGGLSESVFNGSWTHGGTGVEIYPIAFDKVVKYKKGDVLYIDFICEQEGTPGYECRVELDSEDPIFSIDYIPVLNKKDQLEFLMPYDIAYNMPDISCKDFVKAVMQLYGLLVENTDYSTGVEKYPTFFNIDFFKSEQIPNDVIVDWSEKLTSFDKPKIEWNLGLKERNYLRYAEDETDNIFEDAYFTTYETDNGEKDIFKSIFAASDDVSLIGTSYFPVPVCSIPQWVVDEKTDEWKFEGKCKQRIFRAYLHTADTFDLEIVQLFGEEYDQILIDETFAYISYFKDIPADVTDNNQGLDMASIMSKYYGGFIDAVKSNRLFTFQFLLNEIDINRFTHITPVWIEKFSNYFFVKKINNWEAGRTCNVEMLQLYDSGALGAYVPITEIKYGALYNYPAATDERLIYADGWDVPDNTDYETLITYLGGFNPAGKKAKENGIVYWNAVGDGTNEVGFNGRGAGIRLHDGSFDLLKYSCYLITTDISGSDTVICKLLQDGTDQFDTDADQVSRKWACTIRPIKTTTTLTHGQTGTYTGNDGKVYRTICIGTQEWVADNLAETKFRNGDTIPLVTDNSAWAALTTAGMCYYNNDINNA